MGVPFSEVGYTPAMPRREDHEVHIGHVVALDQKNIPWTEREWDCDMTVGCFTDVTVHSSKNYHQEHDRATSGTSKANVAGYGTIILSFHGVANRR